MIDRFNFYDLYGYLIPGFVLLFVLWLPHAMVAGQSLPADLASALVVILIAYVAGHVLQTVAARILSSKRQFEKDGKVVYRSPSDYILDDDDKTLTPGQKDAIKAKIKETLNISNAADGFITCRNALVASKATSYAEQFYGMYILMRGVSAAMAVGCAFAIGCLYQPFVSGPVPEVVAWLAIGLIAVFYRPKPRAAESAWSRRTFAVLLLGVAACTGIAAGAVTYQTMLLLSLSAAGYFLIALWTFGAYLGFTREWARTVYIDFLLLGVYPPKSG